MGLHSYDQRCQEDTWMLKVQNSEKISLQEAERFEHATAEITGSCMAARTACGNNRQAS